MIAGSAGDRSTKVMLPEENTPAASHSRTPAETALWRRSIATNRDLPRGNWKDLIARQLVLLAMLLCGLAAVVLVAHAFALALDNSHDNDWGPARALLHGVDPYKIYLGCTACHRPVFVPPVAPMYPASGLILLWPLAVLPWPVARIAWAVLNLVFGVGLIVTLQQLFLPQCGWRFMVIASIAFFAGAPFLTNLEIGQHAIFALGWFVAALWADRRGNAPLAGAFLAASWFKYTLTLPLSLIFVVRSRWPALLAAAAAHIALTLFAALWTGSSPLDLLLGPLRVVQFVHRAGHLDVFGLAVRLGITSRLVPLVVACALTGAVLAAALRNRAEADLPLLALLSLFAYAVVYHLAYDLAILVIPLFHVMSRVRSWNGRLAIERVWTIMLAVLLGWTWFADQPVQVGKMLHVDWVVRAYPFYYASTAVWFYATLAIGILVVGLCLSRGSGVQEATQCRAEVVAGQ
jgi:Glycosyltransferase family 87